MSYRLSAKGLELAAFTLGVGEFAELGGRRTVMVQAHAKARGLVNMVARVNEQFTSWLDVETGRSLRFQSTEFEKNSTRAIENSLADLLAREGDTIPISLQREDQQPVAEPQKVSARDVWCYGGFLIALRSWEARPGTRLSVEVLRGRWLWRVDVEVRGRENLSTDLGELPALRFEGRSYKLDRGGKLFPNTPSRVFSVWISDDGDRVPLKVVSGTDYGDITMEIVDYQPGTGSRLRP